MQNKSILVLNAGSSSLKFTVFDNALNRLFKGLLEGIGATPLLTIQDANGQVLRQETLPTEVTQADALQHVRSFLDDQGQGAAIGAVGHRVVHGGAHYACPVRVTRQVYADLQGLTSLAPLHQPHNLQPIASLLDSAPDLPQVACFDTAFHRGHAPVVDWFALPRTFEEEGVQRYGFHGLSYEYIAQQLPRYTKARKVIVAHLGNGASLCALQDGKSIDTTMGFTALDGLVMGTRSGSLDPGVLLYCLQHKGMTAAEIERLLYKESGLLGVSGISQDMRALLVSEEESAKQAIDLYCHRAVREIGALTAVLGGLEALVFTAGIGENAAPIRDQIIAGLSWLPELEIHVIPTNEERMIATHTQKVLQMQEAP